MQVQHLMTCDVKSVSPLENLDSAARILWENDCGCVPVIEGDGKVSGMLTDRDICMAAYFEGRPLREIRVTSAMAKVVFSARPEDPIAAAEKLMQSRKVRRLPVVDSNGKLAGILSLNDVARASEHERSPRGQKEPSDAEVRETLAAVSEPRNARGQQKPCARA